MTGLDEILKLRQQPTAYLLLAYLRESHAAEQRFRIRTERLARELGRMPKTIRTAVTALIDRGMIAKSGHLYCFAHEAGKNDRDCDIALRINP